MPIVGLDHWNVSINLTQHTTKTIVFLFLLLCLASNEDKDIHLHFALFMVYIQSGYTASRYFSAVS